ncbi:sodium/bile acid cotransporter 4-like [Lineus longissimus]|uniref:sodium/bile acid cotransporter 4-like n=1 Tax=Lineus longissimus TaxID=88925 RepID=UPI002B4F747D
MELRRNLHNKFYLYTYYLVLISLNALHIYAYTNAGEALPEDKIKTTIETNAQPCMLKFDPPNRSPTQVNDYAHICFNVTCNEDVERPKDNNTYFRFTITTENIAKAIPKHLDDHRRCDLPHVNCESIALWSTDEEQMQHFRIEALHVGRLQIFFRMDLVKLKPEGEEIEEPEPTANMTTKDRDVQLIAELDYILIARRKRRMVDIAFEVMIAGLAMINSFGVGCMCNKESLQMYSKKPMALAATLVCQLIFMPIVAYALAMPLKLSPELALSLILMACIPGGGMGHIHTLMLSGEQNLSRAANVFSAVISLGTAPLWIYATSQYLIPNGPEILFLPLGKLEIWLATVVGPLLIGAVICYFRESSAEALLNWIIKPLLLLASILFGTLGIHINMYMFNVIDVSAALASFLLPLSGFVLGGLAGIITVQGTATTKAMAGEACCTNCMICVVILRFAVPQPDADIASVLPIWGIFLTPIPSFILFLLYKVYRTATDAIQQRKEKVGDFSIASSLAQVTQVSALSTPFLVEDGDSDEEEGHAFRDHDEKVTVL